MNFLDLCDAIVYCKNTEREYIGCNALFKSMFGDPMGKKDADIFTHQEFLEWMKAIDEQVLSTGEAVLNIHEAGEDEHGNPVYVISNKYPLKDAQGKTIGLLGMTVPNHTGYVLQNGKRYFLKT
jgi:hypothetical protein